jgi:pyoverdine/dityrosine biosynthesis protein Dit1
MKQLISIALSAALLISCSGTADNKVPVLAGEMCDCFDSFQQSLSADAKQLLKEVALAENPQQVLMNGIAKLKPDDAKAFAEKLQSLADKKTAIAQCMDNFDKKHSKETTKDRDALLQKLLAEMRRNGNCYTGAAIINLNPKPKD